MKTNQLWIWLIGFVVVAGIAWFAALTFVPVSIVHDQTFIVRQFPANDSKIIDWLARQPGVVAHTVHVTREYYHLKLLYIQTQNAFGRPPRPEIERALKRFGYF